jgi:dihydrodipicolinate synthase/N-acetylneuraminate lyase
MESMNKHQIEEIWNTVAAYLPERMKVDCAVDYIKTLVDLDIDTRIIKSAGTDDERLQQAIEAVLAEDEEVSEDEYYEEE